jgi:catechol 2,3-dioxygenase-like lactoylglutathione lyase family enzyme
MALRKADWQSSLAIPRQNRSRAIMTATRPAAGRTAPLIKMGGVGLNVADMQRSEAFYTDVVCLKVAVRVPEHGPPMEIALSVSGEVTAGDPFVVLANLGEPLTPGREGFGRVIINTTDAEAIARRALAAGFAAKSLAQPGPNSRPVYFLTDPDGYQLELYQASEAEAKY